MANAGNVRFQLQGLRPGLAPAQPALISPNTSSEAYVYYTLKFSGPFKVLDIGCAPDSVNAPGNVKACALAISDSNSGTLEDIPMGASGPITTSELPTISSDKVRKMFLGDPYALQQGQLGLTTLVGPAIDYSVIAEPDQDRDIIPAQGVLLLLIQNVSSKSQSVGVQFVVNGIDVSTGLLRPGASSG